MNDLYEAPEVASKMLVAAMGLIGILTPAQREHLVLPLDDPGARHPVSLVHRSPHPSAPAARAFLTLLSPALPQDKS